MIFLTIIYIGPSTEGVFRVPANKVEVDNVREALDKGNYDCISSLATSVHTVAAVLKSWFRELAVPLIPNEY